MLALFSSDFRLPVSTSDMRDVEKGDSYARVLRLYIVAEGIMHLQARSWG